MNGNYFIIHGSYGNPYKNWIPWLKTELSKRKKDVIVPHFPNLNYQRYDNWSKILDAYLEMGCINENTTFITHSLGSVFIIKYILDRKIKIKKNITSAGFNNIYFDDDNSLYESFYMANIDSKKIDMYVEKVVSFISSNDPFVSLEAGSSFADDIGGLKVLVHDAKHFNNKEFMELLKYI